MAEKMNTYTSEFKLKAVDMYLNQGIGCKRVARELGIAHSMVIRWVNRYKQDGAQGLEENRGKATGSKKGRPKKASSLEEENLRLRAENEVLKKLIALRKG